MTATGSPRTPDLLRLMCLVVGGVAGFVGLVMLTFPADTARYFSWPIPSEPVASLIGAWYVASAIVFGRAALKHDWSEYHALCLSVLALSLPTLVLTVHHDEVFDFGRWQAVAWVLLFLTSPCAFGTVLILHRGADDDGGDPRPLAPGVRAALGVVSGLLAMAAVLIWFDLDRVSRVAPFVAASLGGRFLGSWAAFLAVLGGFAAIRNRWDEARTPLFAWAVFFSAAFLAGLREFGDLETNTRGAYLVVLAGVAVASGLLYARGATRSGRSPR